MATRQEIMTTSAAYDLMAPYWQEVAAIRGGKDAMRAAAVQFLPKFPHESAESYAYRVKVCRFTDIFSDIVDNLASRPFEKDVEVVVQENDAVDTVFADYSEDVDGGNNHLNTFASDLFKGAMTNAIEWVVIDYHKVPEGATLADVKDMGARPYWLRVQADAVLMAIQSMVRGRQELTYFKFLESVTVEQDGETKLVDQVRIFKRAHVEADVFGEPEYELWRATGTIGTADEFELVDSGKFSVPVIPAVPLSLGKIEDNQFLVRPPLRNLADLQVEYFQEENNLKSIKTFTAFPMYVAVGLDQPVGEDGQPVPAAVGPSACLFTGTVQKDEVAPDFKIIEPAGNSLSYLSGELAALEKLMRELGRMPLVAGTAGITQVAAAFASKKASSALQEWAMRLKDALEKCLAITAMWMGYKSEVISPEVSIFTDFSIELSDAEAPRILLDTYKEGVISRFVLRDELKRRGILSPNYNPEIDDEKLLDEVPNGNDTGEYENKPALADGVDDPAADAIA